LLAVTGFASLRLLDVSGCGLDEWSQVAALGGLPALQELLLDANPLSEVLPPAEGEFAQLCRFSLSSTGYASLGTSLKLTCVILFSV
jgi:Leucine-rich repeat (LRR) protein